MCLLIIGSTGTLGRQIVRKAIDEGFQVRCFVRNFRKASFLKEWGAELVYGDLKFPETIPMTLYGVTGIIDCSTARVEDIYNIKGIDLISKYILIESAVKAKIKHYIYFSFFNSDKYKQIPLIHLKLLVENALISSKLNYSIFKLSGFFQGLINQYAVPILDQKSIWITSEQTSIAYINTQDVAKISIKSLSLHNSQKKIFSLAGNKTWTSLEIIKLCEKISGKKAKISRVSRSTLFFLRKFTKFFQWTWNISDRLSFIEILYKDDKFIASMEEIYKIFNLKNYDIESLENYLAEYFQKIMNKLKQLNYKNINQIDQNNF